MMSKQQTFFPQLIGVVAMLLFVSLGAAAENVGEDRRLITVSGSATRWVAPDQASLELSVEGRGKTSAEAMQQAGRKVAAVLAALDSLLDPEQVRAVSTQLRKVVAGTDRYWNRERGEPVEMLAIRSLQLQRVALDTLPAVIEALAERDLASVGQVNVSLSDAALIENELQLAAVDDAKARAQRIVGRLGVRLGLPHQVEVRSGHRPQPKMMRAMALSADESGAGYAQGGQEEMSAEVTIRFEMLPQ